jgi:TPR repeat protein
MLLRFSPTNRWAGAAAVLFVAANFAHADLNADFADCRRAILQIGSNPASAGEQYCLGLSYAFNLNHPKDRARAATWFRRAADQNHPGAQTVLGYFYEQGDGVPPDPVQAANWYRRAAAQGRDDGLFNLGRAYEHGIGVAIDLAQARNLYSQAAAAGSRDAAQALANLGSAPPPASPADTRFDEGVRRYKARDYAAAARIFLSLAEEGHAAAQLQIGYQYAAGEGLSQDYGEAERWYRESAEQGNAVAATNLGKVYEDGIGVQENWAEAVEWYRRAAMQGYAEGQFNLGRAYQFGIAVPQSRQEAIRWFDSAADQGHDQANYFANQLKARNSYIGFRSDAEHAAVVGTRLRTVLLNIEPAGQVFRSSAQRMTYLRGASQQADREEAWQRWNSAKMNYDDCQSSGRSGCIPPGPQP